MVRDEELFRPLIHTNYLMFLVKMTSLRSDELAPLEKERTIQMVSCLPSLFRLSEDQITQLVESSVFLDCQVNSSISCEASLYPLLVVKGLVEVVLSSDPEKVFSRFPRGGIVWEKHERMKKFTLLSKKRTLLVSLSLANEAINEATKSLLELISSKLDCSALTSKNQLGISRITRCSFNEEIDSDSAHARTLHVFDKDQQQQPQTSFHIIPLIGEFQDLTDHRHSPNQKKYLCRSFKGVLLRLPQKQSSSAVAEILDLERKSTDITTISDDSDIPLTSENRHERLQQTASPCTTDRRSSSSATTTTVSPSGRKMKPMTGQVYAAPKVDMNLFTRRSHVADHEKKAFFDCYTAGSQRASMSSQERSRGCQTSTSSTSNNLNGRSLLLKQRNSNGSMSSISLAFAEQLSDSSRCQTNRQSSSLRGSTTTERIILSDTSSFKESSRQSSPSPLPIPSLPSLKQMRSSKAVEEISSPRFTNKNDLREVNKRELLLPSEQMTGTASSSTAAAAVQSETSSEVILSRFTQMGSLQQYFSRMKGPENTQKSLSPPPKLQPQPQQRHFAQKFQSFKGGGDYVGGRIHEQTRNSNLLSLSSNEISRDHRGESPSQLPHSQGELLPIGEKKKVIVIPRIFLVSPRTKNTPQSCSNSSSSIDKKRSQVQQQIKEGGGGGSSSNMKSEHFITPQTPERRPSMKIDQAETPMFVRQSAGALSTEKTDHSSFFSFFKPNKLREEQSNIESAASPEQWFQPASKQARQLNPSRSSRSPHLPTTAEEKSRQFYGSKTDARTPLNNHTTREVRTPRDQGGSSFTGRGGGSQEDVRVRQIKDTHRSKPIVINNTTTATTFAQNAADLQSPYLQTFNISQFRE